MSTEKKIWIIVSVTIALFAYGIYNVYKPDTLPINFIRGEVREIAPGVLIGPYPTEREIKRLRRVGVVAFVNLMNSSNPIEKGLFETESRAAGKYGLKVFNFPMSFTRLKGKANRATVAQAVKRSMEIETGPEEFIYVHCYLGKHRVVIFAKAYMSALNIQKKVTEAAIVKQLRPGSAP